MSKALLKIVLRLLACAAVIYPVWWVMARLGNGAVGLVTCAPLVGIALAKPLLELIGELRFALRRQALRELEGRHFEHKGRAIDIVEDVSGHRWLRITDVRKIIHRLPSAQVLQRWYPQGLQHADDPADARISAEALGRYLTKSTDPDSLRFKLWLEREVIFPARTLRGRSGHAG